MENSEFMIDVEVEVNEKVSTSVHVGDVIYALNQLELPQKWNRVASLLNSIELETDGLTNDHRDLILNWLDKQILKFRPNHEINNH